MSEQEARAAILAARQSSGYDVEIQAMHPAAAIAGVALPEGSFRSETVCMRHVPPCRWDDWAIPRQAGDYRVILWGHPLAELIRPGVTVSSRIQRLLGEE